MPKGFCLSIGLNSIDPRHYQGDTGDLASCENDATDIAVIARAANLECTVLLTRDATATAVLGVLLAQSKLLSASDLLVVYYSGHGGQVGDVSGDETNDKLDETWCLFNRMLLDDELFAMWAKFKPSTRILVISDSCHSGSVAKMLAKKKRYGSASSPNVSAPGRTASEKPVFKALEFTLSWQTYIAHKAWYDSLGYVAANADVKASVLQISACQDDQLAEAGSVNSLFTRLLKTVWANGAYQHSHERFCADIAADSPPFQTPNYLKLGAPNPAFEAQRPFTA